MYSDEIQIKCGWCLKKLIDIKYNLSTVITVKKFDQQMIIMIIRSKGRSPHLKVDQHIKSYINILKVRLTDKKLYQQIKS